MFGKGLYQAEETLLRDIIRSINKKIDYTAREGEGSRFALHLSFRGHKSEICLDLADLKLARTDMTKRHQIRQKIKTKYHHLDKSPYDEDILGLKSAKLLRASPKPEASTPQRGFARQTRR